MYHTVPQALPHCTTGCTPPYHRLYPTVPQTVPHRTTGSILLYHRLYPTVPQAVPHCTTGCTLIYHRLYPTISQAVPYHTTVMVRSSCCLCISTTATNPLTVYAGRDEPGAVAVGGVVLGIVLGEDFSIYTGVSDTSAACKNNVNVSSISTACKTQ